MYTICSNYENLFETDMGVAHSCIENIVAFLSTRVDSSFLLESELPSIRKYIRNNFNPKNGGWVTLDFSQWYNINNNFVLELCAINKKVKLNGKELQCVFQSNPINYLRAWWCLEYLRDLTILLYENYDEIATIIFKDKVYIPYREVSYTIVNSEKDIDVITKYKVDINFVEQFLEEYDNSSVEMPSEYYIELIKTCCKYIREDKNSFTHTEYIHSLALLKLVNICLENKIQIHEDILYKVRKAVYVFNKVKEYKSSMRRIR